MAGFSAQLRQWGWSVLATAVSLAFLAQYVRVGGDWDWMVAMGDHMRRTGEVPDRVPFAEAASDGWHNVPVLGELVASLLHAFDPRSVIVAHLTAVVFAFAVLASVARSRGASDGFVAVCILLTIVGCFATLVVLRAQVWSLALFPLLIALVSHQSCRPNSRIWWAVPLVALWGNLHGAALLGVCFLGAYLLCGRLRVRPGESLAVGTASILALGLNPQGWRTPFYYADVFDNVSAQRSEGLWSRPSLGEPIDVVMLVVIVVLIVAFLRTRHDAWEYVAILGLAAATASAGRNGVWLVFALIALSSAPRAVTVSRVGRDGVRWAMTVAISLALAISVPVALHRGDQVLGAPPGVVDEIVEVSGSNVVLAPAPLSESLAVAGVRLWMLNPLDAFGHADQAAYLDFLSGRPGARRAVDRSDVVVVQEGSAPAELMEGKADFATRECGDEWICYVRGE